MDESEEISEETLRNRELSNMQSFDQNNANFINPMNHLNSSNLLNSSKFLSNLSFDKNSPNQLKTSVFQKKNSSDKNRESVSLKEKNADKSLQENDKKLQEISEETHYLNDFFEKEFEKGVDFKNYFPNNNLTNVIKFYRKERIKRGIFSLKKKNTKRNSFGKINAKIKRNKVIPS